VSNGHTWTTIVAVIITSHVTLADSHSYRKSRVIVIVKWNESRLAVTGLSSFAADAAELSGKWLD